MQAVNYFIMYLSSTCVTGKFVVAFLSLLLSNILQSYAQDATIYVSQFDMGKTMSNLLFSIDKNGFTYLDTERRKAESDLTEGYSGRVQVIKFEDASMNRIIGCEPTAALDFPMRIIVWEEQGDIFIAYLNPIFLKRRYHVEGCDEFIQDLNKRMIRVVNDAIRRV